MNRKTSGLIAAALGLAVLAGAGAGTFALWSDSALLDGGTITAGGLDVEALSTTAADVSADRTDSPHPIDPETWRAVPGDTVRIDYALDVALEGDNLLAALDTSGIANNLADAGVADYVTLSAEVLDADGAPIVPRADGTYLIGARGDGQQAGADEPGVVFANPTLDGVAATAGDDSVWGTGDDTAASGVDATVRVTVAFDADTPDQELAGAKIAEVTGDAVALNQVRPGGEGNFASAAPSPTPSA